MCHLVLIILSLLQSSTSIVSTHELVAPVYDLGDPDQVMVLESELNELSGLSYYEGKLYAMQDEKGSIFTLNPITGKIIDISKCCKKGDYEGIEVVDGFVYLLKNNGNLYKSPVDNISEEKTSKIDLGFDKNWNFEGIGYNAVDKTLLIVAKKSAAANEKEVFCLPINNIIAIGKPCYVISKSELKEKLQKNKTSWSEKMAHKMSYSFNPSGIAVHPSTGDIYILSSPARQLLQLTKHWKIKKILQLDPALYQQPESICFDPDLNLYIGNEARNGKPTILKFHPR